MATSQLSENVITLKGSVDIVTEFFSYGINSILYQRGIYPPDSFKQEQKFGLNMLVTDDEKLRAFPPALPPAALWCVSITSRGLHLQY
ncbi:hypothetical protein PINS_up015197 [Pythium insidiosum]|nr:hypothetical protein PINS_up015197 [Pythium insidiosum]